MNHYATDMLINQGGRHYWFAKYLKKQGYEPVVFSCNVRHGKEGKSKFFAEDALWRLHEAPDGFPFVVIRSTFYSGNGLGRISNMVVFAWNLIKTSKEYARHFGKPDIILASSVHPLTILAGEYIAKKMKVPCIAEVRDLWPESIYEYYPNKKKSLVARLLYTVEKHIYERADSIVFTMEGGRDYIMEKGWDHEHGGPIDLKKVYYINNGVDLEAFDINKREYAIQDDDLNDPSILKLIYAGSIRRANNLDLMLDAAKLEQSTKIRFLIWGDGDQLERMKRRVLDEKIQNIVFKGKVDKKNVPMIVSRADVNFLILEDSPLFRFGLSCNKIFDYLAAGKPIIIIGDADFSIIEKHQCGIHVRDISHSSFMEAIDQIVEMDPEQYKMMCTNAREVAEDYDFKVLTQKLVTVIESHS